MQFFNYVYKVFTAPSSFILNYLYPLLPIHIPYITYVLLLYIAALCGYLFNICDTTYNIHKPTIYNNYGMT